MKISGRRGSAGIVCVRIQEPVAALERRPTVGAVIGHIGREKTRRDTFRVGASKMSDVGNQYGTAATRTQIAATTAPCLFLSACEKEPLDWSKCGCSLFKNSSTDRQCLAVD